MLEAGSRSLPQIAPVRAGCGESTRERLIPGLRAFPTSRVFLAYDGSRAVGVAVCGGLLAVWSLVMCWRSRLRFRFPEFEVEPRLGGGHAAGIGAVISFSSSAVPPARQRDQVPDYMRRM